MPLTDEQAAALQVLVGADPKEVATEIKSKANPVWTLIFNSGHQKATKLTSDAVEKAEKARDEAQEKVRELEGKLETASKGNPDVETVRTQARKELDEAKAEAKKREDELVSTIDNLRRSTILGQLEGLLTDKEIGSLRPAWARNILRDPELRDRIALGKESGEFDVLQKGSKIPIQADEDTPRGKLKALALEIREEIKRSDPDGIAVPVDDGAGDVTSNRGGAGATGGYDPVADGRARAEAQKGAAGDVNSLAWR